MSNWKPGDKVTIVKPHPWEGCNGVLSELMHTIVGPMWRVELDNGFAAGAEEKSLVKYER